MHAILLGVTVSWEDYTSVLVMLGSWFLRSTAKTVDLMLDFKAEIITFIGMTLTLCGIALGIRYIWRRYLQKAFTNWVKWPAMGMYHKLVRNPTSWMLRPFRRLHRRWSEKNLRAKMAKFEERVIADKILDALYDEAAEGRLSKGRFRRLQNEMAVFFNISDLKTKKTHPEAIARQRELLKEQLKKAPLAGPVKKIPGGKPGENVIPIYEGLGHKFLMRRKA